MMGRILVVGSLNMDLVGCSPRIPVVGETLIGTRFLEEPGGKGANQAYAIARLGGRVAMLGRVGDDVYGEKMRQSLHSAGCAVQGVGTVPNCTSGIALIFVSSQGENSIVVIPGANDRFTPEDVHCAAGCFEGVAYVLLQLENPLPTVIAAARRARKAGAKVILDPAPARPLPEELWGLVDIITPNETEALILVNRQPRRLNEEDAMPIGVQLTEKGVHTAIIKLADQGCLLVSGGETSHVPAPRVHAVDTTAAGDVFNAGLAVALSEGERLPDSCLFANRCAALSVTRVGAQAGAPTRAELDLWVKTFSNRTAAPAPSNP